MKFKKKILMIMASLFFFSACGYDIALEPMDSKKKFSCNVLVVPPDSKNNLTEPEISKENSKKTSSLKPENINTKDLANPIILTHADIMKKKAYIQNTKKILKLFLIIADDTGKRKKFLNIGDVIEREAMKYIEIYVKAIVNDSEAINHIETKLEIAKLHLLTAILYFHIAQYDQAQNYLNLIHKRYGSDMALLGTTIDQSDVGCSTISEGVKKLQDRIFIQKRVTQLK